MAGLALIQDSQLDREVLYVLQFHIGKGNAIERWDLVERITGEYVPEAFRNDDNPDDRKIRMAVSRLRAEGHLICDLGDGNGRYIAANEKEFWELYHYYVKPIKVRVEIARAMKQAALRKWPDLNQPSLFDTLETS